MIQQLLSLTVPPALLYTGWAALTALLWSRAAYWKGRSKQHQKQVDELNFIINDRGGTIEQLEKDIAWFRERHENMQHSLQKTREGQIEWLRHRLEHIGEDQFQVLADRLAVFERDLHDLRQMKVRRFDSSFALISGDLSTPAPSASYGSPPQTIKDRDEAARQMSAALTQPVTGAPDPGEGYRLLADGERIEDGDDYLTWNGEWWSASRIYFGVQWHPEYRPVRRRIESDPDIWADAPERMQWHASDADGESYFYAAEPEADEDCAMWTASAPPGKRAVRDMKATLPDPYPDWKNSLRQRPSPQQTV